VLNFNFSRYFFRETAWISRTKK